VDAWQAVLGEILLALAGLAVVLLAVILVLAEVDLMLRLARRLIHRPSATPSGVAGSREVSGERVRERIPAE
jgi:Na+-transporting methylmalonyl-CoA/oxaloacetate decarboxylase gamma subunit